MHHSGGVTLNFTGLHSCSSLSGTISHITPPVRSIETGAGAVPGALFKQAVEPVLGVCLCQLGLHAVQLGLEAADARLGVRAAVGHQRCAVPARQRQPHQLPLSLGRLLWHRERHTVLVRVMPGMSGPRRAQGV